MDLLFRHGYEAMNTRQLAEAAGLKPGSLYYYFTSKEEFLYSLLVDLLREIVADLDEALEALRDATAAQQLDAFVRTLVKWHVQRREETFIASIETRSLSQDRHESYMELRDRFDAMLGEILDRGITEGIFTLPRERIARNAIMSALTAISGWYDPCGPLGLEAITEEFMLLTRRLVGMAAESPRKAEQLGKAKMNGGKSRSRRVKL